MSAGLDMQDFPDSQRGSRSSSCRTALRPNMQAGSKLSHSSTPTAAACAANPAAARTAVPRDQSVDAHLVNAGRLLRKLGLGAGRVAQAGMVGGARSTLPQCRHKSAEVGHGTRKVVGHAAQSCGPHLRSADHAVHSCTAHGGKTRIGRQHALACMALQDRVRLAVKA